jgi:hypothetical protein
MHELGINRLYAFKLLFAYIDLRVGAVHGGQVSGAKHLASG